VGLEIGYPLSKTHRRGGLNLKHSAAALIAELSGYQMANFTCTFQMQAPAACISAAAWRWTVVAISINQDGRREKVEG
jgi:hypothetical protein